MEKQKKPTVVAQIKGISYELLMLIIKIVLIVALFVAAFTFVFGAYRNKDISMFPMIKDGDLVVFYRVDKEYISGDVAVIEYDGVLQARRIVAVEGDTVDITDRGLIINGSLQIESNIYEATYRYNTTVEMPLKVGKNQIFVLGDGRENSTDSRVYGCVDIEDTLGKVIMVIRTRGI